MFDLTLRQRGIVTLLGGFFLMLVSGTVFMWGTLNIYVTSYFRTKNDANLKVTIGGAIFPVMMIFLATGIPVGMRMMRYIGSARITCEIGAVAAALAMFASSYAEEFWQFVLLFGVVHGFSTGIIYFIPIYMGYLYFPNNRGMVSGVITGGFALCSFIFGLIFYTIVNPDSLVQAKNADGFSYFEGVSVEVAQNVPSTLRILSAITGIIAVISSLFLLPYPEQQPKQPITPQIMKAEEQQQAIVFPQFVTLPNKDKEHTLNNPTEGNELLEAAYDSSNKKPSRQEEVYPIEQELAIAVDHNSNQPQEIDADPCDQTRVPGDLTVEQLDKLGAPLVMLALKQPQFYMSIFLGILSLGIGVLVNGNFKTIAKDAGFKSDSYQTLLGSLGGLANGLTRPLWVTLLDRFTFKQIITVILIIEVIFSSTMRFAAKDQVLLAIWVFVTHMTFGAVLGMWPVLSAQINGVRVGSELFGMYWYGFSIANFLQFLIVLLLRDSIAFDNIYFIYTLKSILAIFIVHNYDFKVKWSTFYLADRKLLPHK